MPKKKSPSTRSKTELITSKDKNEDNQERVIKPFDDIEIW